jgi:hypothetical protein
MSTWNGFLAAMRAADESAATALLNLDYVPSPREQLSHMDHWIQLAEDPSSDFNLSANALQQLKDSRAELAVEIFHHHRYE